MKNQATVILRCINDEIFVTVDTDFANPVEQFVFSLNSLLQVDEIVSETGCTFVPTREWNPMFCPLCREYAVSLLSPSQKLKIVYHGKINGWANIVEQTRVALSSYSAWYPQETSTTLDTLFMLRDMDDFFVLNARYDESHKIWLYGEDDYDTGNIIALRNNMYHLAKADNFTFYYIDAKERRLSEFLLKYYEDIMQYYNTIYGKRDFKKFDIVSLGKSGGGAYFRKELVVAENMSGDLDEKTLENRAAHLLAHELGHNWFTGADTNSWEDWLNETGATWASLLYALDRDDDALFAEMLSRPKENYRKTPVIKSPDGSRPENGVHERGTMLLFALYKKYGRDIILSILHCFLEIQPKTTENLLAALNQKVGNSISNLILKGLSLDDYSAL